MWKIYKLVPSFFRILCTYTVPDCCNISIVEYHTPSLIISCKIPPRKECLRDVILTSKKVKKFRTCGTVWFVQSVPWESTAQPRPSQTKDSSKNKLLSVVQFYKSCPMISRFSYTEHNEKKINLHKTKFTSAQSLKPWYTEYLGYTVDYNSIQYLQKLDTSILIYNWNKITTTSP